jgi:hypothetical protein
MTENVQTKFCIHLAEGDFQISMREKTNKYINKDLTTILRKITEKGLTQNVISHNLNSHTYTINLNYLLN